MVPSRCMRRLRSYGALRGAEWQLDTEASEQPVGAKVNQSSSQVPKRRHRLTSQNSGRHLPPTERQVQGGSNMTGTDLYVNKPHCAAAVRP